MLEKFRRTVLVGVASLGLVAASTGSAAAVDITGLRPLMGSFGTCWAPETNYFGSLVVPNPNCAPWSFTRASAVDARGGAWYWIQWPVNDGCLVPNWNREGAPIVVTTCNFSNGQWQWYAWPSPHGGSPFELINGANSNLLIDQRDGSSLYTWDTSDNGYELWDL